MRAEYTAQGKFVPMGACDKVYVTGQGNRAVIGVLDIFGFNGNSPQCLQFFDRLAEAAGVMVAAPDVFRGKPWSLDRFPPKPEDNLMGWIKSITWEVREAGRNSMMPGNPPAQRSTTPLAPARPLFTSLLTDTRLSRQTWMAWLQHFGKHTA